VSTLAWFLYGVTVGIAVSLMFITAASRARMHRPRSLPHTRDELVAYMQAVDRELDSIEKRPLWRYPW
jgi:hypothetical protein